MTKKIIVVEDNIALRTVLKQAFEAEGYTVYTSESSRTVLQKMKRGEGDLVVSDIMLPEGTAWTDLLELRRSFPNIPLIVISGNSTLSTSIKANNIRSDAYFPKPFDLEELINTANNFLQNNQQSNHGGNFQFTALKNIFNIEDILIGKSSAMQGVFSEINRTARDNYPILICGETGTGKKSIAKTIHQLRNSIFSTSEKTQFRQINTTLELNQMLNEANNSEKLSLTLFFPEIFEFDLESQNKITTLFRLASNKFKNTKIICSSKLSGNELTLSSQVHTDLLYQFMEGIINIPPLRSRDADVVLLAQSYLNEINQQTPNIKYRLGKKAIESLIDYSWPGNLLELRRVVSKACQNQTRSIIDDKLIHNALLWFQESINNKQSTTKCDSNNHQNNTQMIIEEINRLSSDDSSDNSTYQKIMDNYEIQVISAALKLSKNNNSYAAKLLGLHRNTLNNKITSLKSRGCKI